MNDIIIYCIESKYSDTSSDNMTRDFIPLERYLKDMVMAIIKMASIVYCVKTFYQVR